MLVLKHRIINQHSADLGACPRQGTPCSTPINIHSNKFETMLNGYTIITIKSDILFHVHEFIRAQ